MRFGPHTITVLRAPFKTDAYGNEGTDRDWDNAARTVVAGVSVQAQPSSEFTQDRDAVVIRKEVYGPPTLDLRAADRVEHDGATYDVDGDPQAERHGTAADHVYALLRRSEDQS
jgi:hypothetical protein